MLYEERCAFLCIHRLLHLNLVYIGMAPLSTSPSGSLCGIIFTCSAVCALAHSSESRRDQDVEKEGRRPSSGLCGTFLPIQGSAVTEFVQKRGWEPKAILNWLALAGWGVQHEPPSSSPSTDGSPKQAPDSTTIMSVEEMIQNVSSLLPTLTSKHQNTDLPHGTVRLFSPNSSSYCA